MAAATAASPRGGAGHFGATAPAWARKDAGEWSSSEVRAFLDTTLPGHECAERLGHLSGRVLCSLDKEDLRKQARDEEATNVIWAELRRLRAQHQEREDVRAHGSHPYTVIVRTPADVAIEIEVLPEDAVLDLKARVAGTEGTTVEAQRLMWNGVPMLDARTLASYNIHHGAVILLVPRLATSNQRYAPAPASSRAARAAARSGIPRPQVPVVCNDIARPFTMSLEFPNIPEYQSFMLAVQRQVGRKSHSGALPDREDEAPFLEVLPVDSLHAPVQTRVIFDPKDEVLLIDTIGDILMEFTRYRVLLHLRDEQKLAHLVTGERRER